MPKKVKKHRMPKNLDSVLHVEGGQVRVGNGDSYSVRERSNDTDEIVFIMNGEEEVWKYSNKGEFDISIYWDFRENVYCRGWDGAEGSGETWCMSDECKAAILEFFQQLFAPAGVPRCAALLSQRSGSPSNH